MKTNVFYHGDCLFVMRHDIPPESIDLIYLDPPFFTGKVQKGEWKPGDMQISYDDSKAFWSNKEIQDNAPNWLKEFAKWDPKSYWHPFARYLYYMYERLDACHQVLKPTGSIYLHCDQKASHYLKIIMDKRFGYQNFRNEVVWWYPNKLQDSRKRLFAREVDYLLSYTKTNIFTFKHQYDKREKPVKHVKIKKENGKKVAVKDDKGNIEYVTSNTRIVGNIWKIPMLTNQKERTGYPTQKPRSLLKRIIETSSNKGDIILDPFCGCGTTLVAAHELDRNWIGIDINDKAFEIIKDRGKQTKLDIIINAPVLIRNSKGIYEWVMSLTSKEHKIFEDWVNDFYGAVKPSPDRGVDGITKDGIPIQTKIYKVGYNIVSEFLNNAKYHPDVRIKKPLKTVKLVSQKGFDESAWQMVSEIKTNEGIKVELIEPKDMLKAEDLIK